MARTSFLGSQTRVKHGKPIARDKVHHDAGVKVQQRSVGRCGEGFNYVEFSRPVLLVTHGEDNANAE